ncbi:MAG TPA: hypothetical protein VF457_15475 [Burkholderiaceae bacterium]
MPSASARRRAYCIMGAGSLPYARRSLQSLCERSMDALDVRVITDEDEDKARIAQAMGELGIEDRHAWSVTAKAELDEAARTRFARHPELLALREGHPCWRKITDPLLMAEPGEEILLLDPDLYFPNRFRFEPTPARGVLLMRQPPHCLLPHETVMNAYDRGIALAHHVDIGVAQLRHDLDLDWMDAMVAALRRGGTLPRRMHVEAIIWSGVALREGGGYLDPTHWHCWTNAQWKRVALKLGSSGVRVLGSEDFGQMKCFHGGGPAKWWIPDFIDAGCMPAPKILDAHVAPRPFEELTRDAYLAGQRWKDIARRLGYYRLFGKG